MGGKRTELAEAVKTGAFIVYNGFESIRAGLPALTVGQLSGTSVAMIERHYGHLVLNDAEEALAGLAI